MALSQANPSLFDRLGGRSAVAAVVGAFYFNVLNDPRVSHLFEQIDVERLRGHQERFLAFSFGGPARYQGRSLRRAHRGLVEKHGLNGAHFDAVLENLEKSMADLGVAQSLVREVLDIAQSVRSEVLDL